MDGIKELMEAGCNVSITMKLSDLKELVSYLADKNYDKQIDYECYKSLPYAETVNLECSERLRNALKSSGIVNWEDLHKFQSKDIMRIRNCGKHTYQELLIFRRRHGI